MNKRGISVIISSILLILIVISLFSVVAYFMRKSPEKIMQEGSESFEKMINCDNINLQIENVCFKSTGENYFRITIKNNNNFKLEDFKVKLSSGESGIVGPAVSPVDSTKSEKPFIEPYGVKFTDVISERDINWIKLYPIINGQTCGSKEYKINTEGVDEC